MNSKIVVFLHLYKAGARTEEKLSDKIVIVIVYAMELSTMPTVLGFV